MKAAAGDAAMPGGDPANSRPVLAAALLLASALWGQLFFVLAPSWIGATYYDYGWLIPPFVLLFAWRRWQDLGLEKGRRGARSWLWGLVIAGLLLLIPLRIVEHVDVYWRLPLWIHTGVVLGVTHLTVVLLYGWRISRGLLPATLLVLLAVPIPSFIEGDLVNGLTGMVVGLAAGTLPVLGFRSRWRETSWW